MVNIAALSLGIVFGLGLILSGMTNPANVQAFLDVAGLWNPSLGVVMAGAIAVAIMPFRRAVRQGRSWQGEKLWQPERTAVDAPLLLGSVLFGIGWGLSGFCPGPALIGLGAGYLPAVAFTIAMVFGMEIHNWMVAAQQQRLTIKKRHG